MVTSDAFEVVRELGTALPEVEEAINWAGYPVLRARGTFLAGLASHASAEPETLVVRCGIDDRERFIDDAPDTYYITDYYQPYPLVLVRLSVVTREALRDLLKVSWGMAAEKVRGAKRKTGELRASRPRKSPTT